MMIHLLIIKFNVLKNKKMLFKIQKSNIKKEEKIKLMINKVDKIICKI